MRHETIWTLLNCFVVGMFIFVLGSIVWTAVGALTGRDDSYCRSGYKWVMDATGTAHQVWGKDGPVECKQ